MKRNSITAPCVVIAVLLIAAPACERTSREIQRPERIVSKRTVVYDSATYAKLAGLWKQYCEAFPSEDAYANWMYATRYDGLSASGPREAFLREYQSLLDAGLDSYPANPVLLYLAADLMHAKDAARSREFLEKSARLDPFYTDPLFGLVTVYMRAGDHGQFESALRRLLDAGAIRDEVLDYSFNMLASMDSNAILITNGDNDTYPGWAVTRIHGYRSDVRIVNRSLLNTDWYPSWIMRDGVPGFITPGDLDALTREARRRIAAADGAVPVGGLVGDTLIARLVEAAERAGRPVYFAATMYPTDMVDRIRKEGRDLGLVTLVTPARLPYRDQLRWLCRTWTEEFRTGGLDSWRLRYAKESDAGRMLAMNYPSALRRLMATIMAEAPEFRLRLFRWYREHLHGLIPADQVESMNRLWCRPGDPEEMREWCREQGVRE